MIEIKLKFKILVLSVFMFGAKLGFTQDFNHYQNIKNKGKLPTEYSNLASETYKKNVNQVKAGNDENIKLKDKKEFLLESNFAITELLRSGRILFNSPINDYVNKIVDKLLASNDNLSKTIKVYIVQSSIVNAFTFSDGKVFVNMGLLAHVKNEAQLAFILAHEISHYTKGHSYNIFVERKKIEKGVDEYEDFDESDKIFASNSFNKEQETEADAEGLKLFAKTDYNMEDAKKALEMLYYTEQPYDNVLLSADYFNKSFLTLPKVYLPDSADEFVVSDEKDETTDDDNTKQKENEANSTHPSISKRIRTLDKVNLGKYEREGGKSYLVSESEFHAIQKISRFELCRLYSLNFRPIENLYNIYLLEKEEPNSYYLALAKLRSLYQIVNATNKGYRKSVMIKPEKVYGELQKLHHFFYYMTKEELNAYCLRTAWDIKVQIKDDPKSASNDYVQSIVFGFANNISTKLSYFKSGKDYNDSLIQSWYVPVGEKKSGEKPNKKGKSKFTKVKNKGTFANYTMIPYVTSPEFKDYFLEVSEKIDEKTKEDEDNETEIEKTKSSIKITKTKNLGITKLVFLDPNYLVIDQRKKQSNRYIEAEKKEIQFQSTLAKCADAAKIESEYIIPNEIKNSEEYNEYTTIRSRMNECLNNEDFKPLSTDIHEVNDFIKKHETEYVAVLVNLAITDQKDIDEFTYGCMYSILSYGLYLPIFIYSLTKPECSNAIVLAVFNIKTGEIKYGNIRYSKEKDNNDLLSSELYNLFIKLK